MHASSPNKMIFGLWCAAIFSLLIAIGWLGKSLLAKSRA
jgi:hypothetical protein